MVMAGLIEEAVRRQKKPNKMRKPEPAASFKPGDLVQLKSGGFLMTVFGLVDTCATKSEHIEVLWSHGNATGNSYRDICRDVIPTACLKHADLADLTDNIPF
jgi:hypothetical protein